MGRFVYLAVDSSNGSYLNFTNHFCEFLYLSSWSRKEEVARAEAKPGPVVGDWVSCGLVLPHWEGEQVEARLVRVFPDVELEKSFNRKLALHYVLSS